MNRLGFPPWAQNLRAEIHISDFCLPLPMSETHSDNVEMSVTFSMQSKLLGKISCEFQNEEF